VAKGIQDRFQKEWLATSPRPITRTFPQEFFDWGGTSETNLEDLRQGKVRVLNREFSFSLETFWEEVDRAGLPPLILETLHYHRFLLDWLQAEGTTEEDVERVLALLNQWMLRYPPGSGRAWDPFTVAYRSQIWIRFSRTALPKPSFEADLFRHGLHLERNLETHLGGNHLWKDFSALLLLSACFEGPTSDRWFETGSRLLQTERVKQVLPDGGHYERTPMYHVLVLGDLLDVRDLLLPVRPEWVEMELNPTLDRMADCLEKILHPDGEIPFFNDSVLGQAPPPALALKRIGILPSRPNRFEVCESTGIARLKSGELTLLFKGGRLGPDELMGHVHNDTLSIEVSVGNDRFIVNRGVYEYTSGQKRGECRSIRSHNTPCLNGLEQSEIWSSFRVGDRWHPDRWEARPEAIPATVSASWARPGMGRISRTILSKEPGEIEIRDQYEGSGHRSLSSPFHFSSGTGLANRGCETSIGRKRWTWLATKGGATLELVFDMPDSLTLEVEETLWWPRFYVEEEAFKLTIRGELKLSDWISIELKS